MGVLRNARIGIVGAIILGLGRALGETMAVAMVIGATRKSIAPCLPMQLNGYSHRNEYAEAISVSTSAP